MKFILLFLLFAGTASAQDLCSDYGSSINCVGKRREIHRGIDFGGPEGAEAISATYGVVVRRNWDDCAGHGITVKSDIAAPEGPVFVRYAHVEGHSHIQPGQVLRPGDPLGKLIPLMRTKCHGSRTHVHYELRVNNDPKKHVDPHPFWADGPGKVTCFTAGTMVPKGKAVAPMPCAGR